MNPHHCKILGTPVGILKRLGRSPWGRVAATVGILLNVLCSPAGEIHEQQDWIAVSWWLEGQAVYTLIIIEKMRYWIDLLIVTLSCYMMSRITAPLSRRLALLSPTRAMPGTPSGSCGVLSKAFGHSDIIV